MRYLLDTHVWLWAESSPEKIAAAVRAILDDPRSELFVSAASAHEIAIKWRLGKLTLPVPPTSFVRSRLARSRLLAIPVTVEHAAHVSTLPAIHEDPFDRLLVAQSQLEGMTILTRDPMIQRYAVTTIAA